MTPSLVIKHANLEVTHPVCDFAQLYTFETAEARNCLGRDLYKAMVDDLAEYPTAGAYSNTMAYDIGDKVVYDGTIYVAIAVTVGSLPVDHTKWELAQRFTTECYNVLFCTVLATYLAWVTVRRRLPFINTKIGGTGLIKNKSSNFDAANEHDYNSLQAGAAAMVQLSWQALVEFMEDNKANTCYAGFMAFTCNTCGCAKTKCICTKASGWIYEFA